MKITLTTISLLLVLTLTGQSDNYSRIRVLSDSGNHKEVIKLSSTELTKLKNTDTLYKKIIRTRVDSYMATEDFLSAIEDWKELIELNPNEHTYYEGIAFGYWAIGNLINCVANIDIAYKLAPSDPTVLSNMAYYYSESGKFKECINYATTGLQQKNLDNNNRGLLLNNRGYAYLNLKEYDKALIDINNSIAVFPDNSFPYFYRAIANIELNKMETVCQDLEKCKSLGGGRMSEEFIKKYCSK